MSHLLTLFTLLVALAAAPLQAMAAAASCEAGLRPHALVRGNPPTLGDLIESESVLPDTLWRKPVTRLLPASVSLSLSRADIEKALGRALEGCGGKFIWRGAEAVQIVRSATIVDMDRLGQAVESVLRARWGTGAERMAVALIPLEVPLTVPEGELAFEVALAPGVEPRSRTPVRVRMLVGGRPVASVVVWCRVELWKTVYKAREPMAPGGFVEPDALEPVLADVAAMTVPAYQASVERGRLRAPVAAGEVLTRRHVSTLLIARDERVRLEYSRSGIALDAEVIAVGDAEFGREVLVRKPGSNEVLRAVAVGPHRVAVKE